MKSFRDLVVWEKSHQLTLNVYKGTGRFPTDERYGLCSQLRRAVVSIESNIAEGCGRRGNGEFHKFLQSATGSANEVECQLLISKDLGYLNELEYEQLSAQVVEVRRMLGALITKVSVER